MPVRHLTNKGHYRDAREEKSLRGLILRVVSGYAHPLLWFV